MLPALAVAFVLFLWSAREKFEDTAGVHGPPYGNSLADARNIISMMTPEMLASIATEMNVPEGTISDADAIKIVHGNDTNNSPISQLMSNFYWQVYKPATSTISIAQVNKFIGLQENTWVKANVSSVRNFLTRYYLQGQNGAAQSGYLEILNSAWASGQKKPEVEKTTETADTNTPTDTKTSTPATTTTPDASTLSTLAYVSIFIFAISIFAVLGYLLLA